MDSLPLLKIHGSAPLMLFHGDPKQTAVEACAWRKTGLTVWFVRGHKMRTVDRLFDEVSAALQFPHYFGENWSAFDECLADMEWSPSRVGFVVVVLDAIEVLSDESEAELGTLVSVIAHAAETYAEAIDSGEWWDRSALPFHVVLQADQGESALVRLRWGASGATVSVLHATSTS